MWVKVIIWLIVCLGVLFLLAVALLYYFQEKLIFFPEKLPPGHRFTFSQPFTEDNFQVTGGKMINAIHFEVPDEKGWVFYLHGNAGNLQSWGERAVDFTSRGYSCTMIDYRGYGKSTGQTDPKNIFTDAGIVLREMTKRKHPVKPVIYGCSLGTGIAAWLAAEEGCSSLILETPYLNLGDISAQHYPFIPHNLLLRYPMRTDKCIGRVKCPVYLIHGTKDEVIYYASSTKLLKLLKPEDKLFTIHGGKHNDLPGYPEFRHALDEILP